MKKKKKWLWWTLAVILLLSSGVAGIWAFLCGSDSVTNTLVIGGVNVEIVENFTPPTSLDAGSSFTKDVKVQNVGPSDGYIRVKVLFSDSDMENISSLDWNTTDWTDGGDGYWYYTKPLEDGEITTSLFTTVTLSSEITEEEIKDFDIYVYAEAYQSKGYEDYKQAWDEFEKNKPKNLIPEGATYTVASTGKVLEGGDEFPETVEVGDIYTYGDYEYRYGYERVLPGESGISGLIWITSGQEKWGVAILDRYKETCGELLTSINGVSGLNLEYTWAGSWAETYPDIPEGVTSIKGAYQSSGIVTAPAIPSSVRNMICTFQSCTSLTGEVEVNVEALDYYSSCFYYTVENITITGSCSDEIKANLAGTATEGRNNVTY